MELSDYVEHLKKKYPEANLESLREAKRHRWVLVTTLHCGEEWREFLLFFTDGYELTNTDGEIYENAIDTWLTNNKQEVSLCQG